MDRTFAFIQTVSLAAAATGLVLAGMSLRELAKHVRQNGIHIMLSYLMTSSGGTGRLLSSRCGYAIYMWTNGEWVVETDFSQPGYETARPSIPGSYEGQLVRKEAAPK